MIRYGKGNIDCMKVYFIDCFSIIESFHISICILLCNIEVKYCLIKNSNVSLLQI